MTSHTIKQFAGLPTPRALLPIGHPDRDIQTVEYLRIKWDSHEMSVRHWENMIKELVEEKVWERYPPDKPYGTINTLLKKEIGYDLPESMKEVDRRAADYLAQVATPANKPCAPVGNKNNRHCEKDDSYKPDNNKGCKYGTDPEYLTSVIARDRPDILERMKQGEFKSVRAAAIEAGITKPKQTWTAPTDIPKLVRAICKRYNEDQIRLLAQILLSNTQEDTTNG
jgi:hypothetical protein